MKGKQFELTSWRRDGLMARLRERGFNIRTLADQIAVLPNLPRAERIGAEVTRPLVTPIERFSYFDPLALAWVQVDPHEHEGQRLVTLRDGWVVRRRKGRGAAAYYFAFAERTGGAGLRPTTEDKAMMMGYAQATGVRERDLTARRADKYYIIPILPLPAAYRKVLARMAEETDQGWRVHERGWPLVGELFAKLGILLRAVEPQSEPATATKTPKPKDRGQR